MHDRNCNNKLETQRIEQLLPADTFLDVSQFQVFLDDKNKLVTSSQGSFGQMDICSSGSHYYIYGISLF